MSTNDPVSQDLFVRLSTVPEPGTATLLVLSATGLAVVLRRH
jgi:hypothetical protein